MNKYDRHNHNDQWSPEVTLHYSYACEPVKLQMCILGSHDYSDSIATCTDLMLTV